MVKETLLLLAAYTMIGVGGVSTLLLLDIPTNKVFFSLIILLYPISHILMTRLVSCVHAGEQMEDLHNPDCYKVVNENAHSG